MAPSPFSRRGAPRRRGARLLILAAVLLLAVGSVWSARGTLAPALAQTFPTWAERYKLRRVERHKDVILAASAESGVEAELLAGVMLAESSGRVGVTSRAGALGLFQLAPVTAEERARELGLSPPTEEQLLSDPLLNARLGANYFAHLLERFERNEEAALVAYNRGPTRVRRWITEAGGFEAWRQARLDAGGSPLLDYARRVLRYRELFRERGTFHREPTAAGG